MGLRSNICVLQVPRKILSVPKITQGTLHKTAFYFQNKEEPFANQFLFELIAADPGSVVSHCLYPNLEEADMEKRSTGMVALLKWPFSSSLHGILVKASLQFRSISSLMQHEFHLIDFKPLFIAHVVLKTHS